MNTLTQGVELMKRGMRSDETPHAPEPTLGSALGGAFVMPIYTDSTRSRSVATGSTVAPVVPAPTERGSVFAVTTYKSDRTCTVCGVVFRLGFVRGKYCSRKCMSIGYSKAIESKFLSRVRRGGKNECWPWEGRLNEKGYGRLKVGHGYIYAHRFSYALAHSLDVMSMTLHVCHSCDNRVCCNPNHLWLGTNSDNVRDRVQKGRSHRSRRPSGSMGIIDIAAFVDRLTLIEIEAWSRAITNRQSRLVVGDKGAKP